MYTDVWNMFDFITSICFDSQVQSTVISHQHHWHSPISDACTSSMTPAQSFLTCKSILSLYLMISSFAHYLGGHSQWPRQDLRGPERCGPCGLSWTQLPLCLPLQSLGSSHIELVFPWKSFLSQGLKRDATFAFNISLPHPGDIPLWYSHRINFPGSLQGSPRMGYQPLLHVWPTVMDFNTCIPISCLPVSCVPQESESSIRNDSSSSPVCLVIPARGIY